MSNPNNIFSYIIGGAKGSCKTPWFEENKHKKIYFKPIEEAYSKKKETKDYKFYELVLKEYNDGNIITVSDLKDKISGKDGLYAQAYPKTKNNDRKKQEAYIK